MKGSAPSRDRLPPELRKFIDGHLYDAELRGLLAAADETPAKFDEALRRMKRQITLARKSILDPNQNAEQDEFSPMYRLAVGLNLQECWARIISDAGNVALVLCDAYEEFHGQRRKSKQIAEKVQERIRAERISRALHYMLHAMLYQMHASVNLGTEGGAQVPGLLSASRHTNRREIVRQVRNRLQLVESFAQTLRFHRALLPGELEAGFAVVYGEWSVDFAHATEDELGWGLFARPVSLELRYRRDVFEQRQRWREVLTAPALAAPLRVIWAVFGEAFKWMTGYGRKPARFLVTACLTILMFTALYGLNDYAHGAALSPQQVGTDLYTTIVYLTSVGSDRTLVGFAPALVCVESLLGYFLLSVLAALLFTWFADR
jgi:hypothetical protein